MSRLFVRTSSSCELILGFFGFADVKHGTLGGTLMVARNLGKMGRKGVTLNPGHFTQLGESRLSSGH